MPKLRNLAALGAAAQAARQYARTNPEKTEQYLGKAAAFADRQTKGKYTRQIEGVRGKARRLATGNSNGNDVGTTGAGTDPEPPR